eukprot:COSAG02_NODE_157_length_32999_cov_31.863647_26_plen_61_part_00
MLNNDRHNTTTTALLTAQIVTELQNKIHGLGVVEDNSGQRLLTNLQEVKTEGRGDWGIVV